jgi:hypothetical protein
MLCMFITEIGEATNSICLKKVEPQPLHHWQNHKIKQASVLIDNSSQKIGRRDDSQISIEVLC